MIRSEVSLPLRVGCHSAATLGASAASELVRLTFPYAARLMTGARRRLRACPRKTQADAERAPLIAVTLQPYRRGARMSHGMRRAAAHLLVLAGVLSASGARALDKQGSAHDAEVYGADSGFNASGTLIFGTSLYNPSYPARPGNTGLALYRYAAHADIDLVGRRLSLPIDLNAFTDAARTGGRRLVPSEGDVIAGITSTWLAGPGAIELGLRGELDSTLDATTQELQAGAGQNSQGYVDTRARYLYSLRGITPALGRALGDGDVSGYFTLGWFAYNPSYSARPDLSGIALLRYAGHVEVSVWGDRIAAGFDVVMFTDRNTPNPARPSEVDLTPEMIAHAPPFEVHLAYERDMPVDRGGLVQDYAYALFGWHFDAKDLLQHRPDGHEIARGPAR